MKNTDNKRQTFDMKPIKKKSSVSINDIIMILMTLIACMICYSLVIHRYINWDVAWHIEGAKRMLHGGHYLTNLFDDNPPMVFMYFVPLAIYKEITGVLTVNAAYIYSLSIYFISFVTSYLILKSSDLKILQSDFVYFIIVVSTLFIGSVFIGQRELNAMCLFTPYLIMNLLGVRSSGFMSFLSAVLAAIGIGQAPFYILLPLLIDIVQCVSNKCHVNKNQVMFYLLFIGVTGIGYILYPEYYHAILHLAYIAQSALNDPYRYSLINIMAGISLFGFTLIALSLFYFSCKKSCIKLLLLMVASFMIYFLEQKGWFYHLYPAVYCVILSFSFLIILNSRHGMFRVFFISYSSVFMLFMFYASFSTFLYADELSFKKNSTVHKLIMFARSKPHDQGDFLFSQHESPRPIWLACILA